jgi:hypothetical protein
MNNMSQKELLSWMIPVFWLKIKKQEKKKTDVYDPLFHDLHRQWAMTKDEIIKDKGKE